MDVEVVEVLPVTDHETLKVNEEQKLLTQDPYAYLERNEFTSEKFKIEIRGLPKHYGITELRKLLNKKLKLNCRKIKPPKLRSEWVYVCFHSENEREKAISSLNGYKWKNKILRAETASAIADPLVKKRNEFAVTNNTSGQDTKKFLEESIKNNIVPLWNVPYDQQLEIKRTAIVSALRSLISELLKVHRNDRNILEYIQSKQNINDGMLCPLSGIKYTPVHEGYRNKCEFTIGMDYSTNEKRIGFRIGTYATGSTGIIGIEDMPHVPERMKIIVKVFESWIQESELDVFNPENQSGYWRQLTVKLTHATNQLMLVICIHPQQLTKEEKDSIQMQIKEFFEKGPGAQCNVTSLYLQFVVRKKAGCPSELIHLLGEKNVIEILCNLEFVISPESFFQINTVAAQVLYETVNELAEVTKDTTLLDVCCGTGSIGLSMSKNCGQVLGLDSVQSAIDMAKVNCLRNNISNCSFYHGTAEEILTSVASRATNENIVAIVDPPRAGLHQKTITQLRKIRKIRRIVYLSCNPSAAMRNIVNLGKPSSKTLIGDPFIPTAAVPVDMFPHTKHCELVLLLQRLDVHNADSCANE